MLYVASLFSTEWIERTDMTWTGSTWFAMRGRSSQKPHKSGKISQFELSHMVVNIMIFKCKDRQSLAYSDHIILILSWYLSWCLYNFMIFYVSVRQTPLSSWSCSFTTGSVTSLAAHDDTRHGPGTFVQRRSCRRGITGISVYQGGDDMIWSIYINLICWKANNYLKLSELQESQQWLSCSWKRPFKGVKVKVEGRNEMPTVACKLLQIDIELEDLEQKMFEICFWHKSMFRAETKTCLTATALVEPEEWPMESFRQVEPRSASLFTMSTMIVYTVYYM